MKMSWHKKLSRQIRSRLRKKVLARAGIGVCADTDNGFFIVDPGDFVVSRSLLERGEYDRREIEWLQRVVGPAPSTIVIVGVHVGAVLVPLAKRAARVIGFEPNPPTYKLARLNLLLNEIGNTTLEHLAIGAGSGTVSIVNNPINTGNASISITTTAGSTTIPLTSLDLYCPAKGIDSIDLLIIDIEGHELHALRGADQTLQRTAN
ncbi:MAG TPA: FkbM family methyltransferase, partial [Opitutus sp.]|nr:FkbM family methyltransferase [Opitutus sp.]